MKEEVVRSILRLMAIATTLVGAILTLQALLAQSALLGTMKGAPKGVQIQTTNLIGELSAYGIAAQAVPMVLGVALYFASPLLARHVAE